MREISACDDPLAGLGRRLSREFYARNALAVAPELLNKVLATGDGRAGRIVEVEAYRGADDPGSHGHRGRTPRTAVMFGPPGHLYVYFTYGMHWCANVVVESDGLCAAVLLRALTPLRGLEAMRVARGTAARRDRDLCSGPAKLTQALGLDGDYNGANLMTAGPTPTTDGGQLRAPRCSGPDPATGNLAVAIVDDGCAPPPEPVQATRIGITKGADLPWRWYVPGVTDVSQL